MKTITIPAAFMDAMVAKDLAVPMEIEIIRKGKGKQYVIEAEDKYLNLLISWADDDLLNKTPLAGAAKSLLLALRRQGHKMDLHSTLNLSTAKPVTRKTDAKGTGMDRNRDLIVTIMPNGDLILRPQGRRQAEQVSLSSVYAWAQRNRCLQLARDKAAARKAKRKSK